MAVDLFCPHSFLYTRFLAVSLDANIASKKIMPENPVPPENKKTQHVIPVVTNLTEHLKMGYLFISDSVALSPKKLKYKITFKQ